MHALSVRTDKASAMLPSEVTGEDHQHCASEESTTQPGRHMSTSLVQVDSFFLLLIVLPRESKVEHWIVVQKMLPVRWVPGERRAFLPELAHVGNCQDPYPLLLWLGCD